MSTNQQIFKMKRILLSAFLLVALMAQINAQNSISLKINHKLANADFTMNQGATNNLGDDFNVNRLEYYISEISVVHDGGLETDIDDLWILVGAGRTVDVELGEYDITTVEQLKLHIGVEEEYNHLDPSTYESSHPLAPKNPSMHWGWSAGYRFVAIEGNGGSDFNQVFQLHGLGDSNYFTTTIDLDITAENAALEIALDADYTRVLEDISVSSGVISHGETGAAKKCVENFRDFVFSPAGESVATIDFSEVSSFKTFPNPVVNGSTRIELDVTHDIYSYDLSITSMDGRQLQYLKAISNGQQIDLNEYASGMYLINLIKEGQSIISHKLFVR